MVNFPSFLNLDLEQFELHERAELELFRDIEAILDASSHGNILPSTLLKDGRVARIS